MYRQDPSLSRPRTNPYLSPVLIYLHKVSLVGLVNLWNSHTCIWDVLYKYAYIHSTGSAALI